MGRVFFSIRALLAVGKGTPYQSGVNNGICLKRSWRKGNPRVIHNWALFLATWILSFPLFWHLQQVGALFLGFSPPHAEVAAFRLAAGFQYLEAQWRDSFLFTYLLLVWQKSCLQPNSPHSSHALSRETRQMELLWLAHVRASSWGSGGGGGGGRVGRWGRQPFLSGELSHQIPEKRSGSVSKEEGVNDYQVGHGVMESDTIITPGL